MARKKIARTLDRLPGGSPVSTKHQTADRVLEIMRRVALKNQKENAQSFYSVRDIATHFHVPISSVSRIYGHLEDEGLLSRVRGSKTILQGAHYDRHLTVRGFIGLPTSLSSFVTVQDYRMFFIRLRGRLRASGFATSMPFFQQRELENGALTDRFKADRVDTVVWFQPPRRARQALYGLTDNGIRVLGVSDGESTNLPCRYQLRRERAIGHLLRDWKENQKIRSVVVAESRGHRAAANEAAVQAELDELEIKSEVMNFDGKRASPFLSSLGRAKTDGIIFPSASLAALLCFRRPALVTELLQKHRVAFIGGPANMPFAAVPEVLIDLVTFDRSKIDSVIAADLVSQTAFKKTGPTVFEAQAHLRVPLNHFAQPI